MALAAVLGLYLADEERFLGVVNGASPFLRSIWFGAAENFDAETFGFRLIFWAAGIAGGAGFLFYIVAIRKLDED